MSMVEQTLAETFGASQQLTTESVVDLSLSFGVNNLGQLLIPENQLANQSVDNPADPLSTEGRVLADFNLDRLVTENPSRVQGFSYTSKEGITYHAENREDAIALCPFLGSKALASPDSVDRILNLVQRGMAMMDSPDTSGNKKAAVDQARPEARQSRVEQDLSSPTQPLPVGVLEKPEPQPVDQIANHPRPTKDYLETYLANERVIRLNQTPLDKDNEQLPVLVEAADPTTTNRIDIPKLMPEQQGVSPIKKILAMRVSYHSTSTHQNSSLQESRVGNPKKPTEGGLKLVPMLVVEKVSDFKKERLKAKAEGETINPLSKPALSRVKPRIRPNIVALSPNVRVQPETTPKPTVKLKPKVLRNRPLFSKHDSAPEVLTHREALEHIVLVAHPTLVKEVKRVELVENDQDQVELDAGKEDRLTNSGSDLGDNEAAGVLLATDNSLAPTMDESIVSDENQVFYKEDVLGAFINAIETLAELPPIEQLVNNDGAMLSNEHDDVTKTVRLNQQPLTLNAQILDRLIKLDLVQDVETVPLVIEITQLVGEYQAQRTEPLSAAAIKELVAQIEPLVSCLLDQLGIDYSPEELKSFTRAFIEINVLSPTQKQPSPLDLEHLGTREVKRHFAQLNLDLSLFAGQLQQLLGMIALINFDVRNSIHVA